MAKDKSKKKSNDDAFAKPSEAPAGGDGWSLTDGDEPKSGKNDGVLFLITPLRKQTVVTERYGEKEVIVCDVVEINEKKPEKSIEHEEVFVFGAWLQGSLRAYIGERKVLGRLDKAKDKDSGRGYVWKFEDASEKEEGMARAYLESLDPFKPKSAKKSKPDADEKPSKKAKDSKPDKGGKKSKAAPEPEPKAKKKSKKK